MQQRLEDTPRKILRILYHLHQQNWVRPDIVLVSRLSLRSEDRVREAIKSLRSQGYVEISEGKMRILIPEEPEMMTEKPAALPKSAYRLDGWMD
jgi:hypothetical protein